MTPDHMESNVLQMQLAVPALLQRLCLENFLKTLVRHVWLGLILMTVC